MSRPTRASSSSTKTVTVRLTQPEHDLLTKAAGGAYLSEWVRRVSLENAARELKIFDPVEVSAEVRAIVDRACQPMMSIASEEKRALVTQMITTVAEHIQRLADKLIKAYQLIETHDNEVNDMWRLLKKFAGYIRHDAGCPVYPCGCSIAPVTVEVSTALHMSLPGE